MSQTIKMAVRGCYKIFGAYPEKMVDLVRGGMSKTELLQRHAHVSGLRDINVDMRAGQITVIMGLSGSGKSTLIRHLNGLIAPTAGEILLDGVDITTLSASELREVRRSSISMVFQNFALMPHQTVLQNVGMAKRVRGEATAQVEADAKRWINRLGLAGFENRYPHQLSGGMQQRVGIARALSSDADVLLMDEAFSALDPLTRKDMQDLLLELQRELYKTIVFITHDLDEALRIADHIVMLKDGEVVQQGDPQSIVLRPANDYVERFVNDINRGRLLRVESLAQPATVDELRRLERIDVSATLEDALMLADGDPDRSLAVMRHEQMTGVLHLRDVIKAMLPNSATKSVASQLTATPVVPLAASRPGANAH
jgi:glycine betaine/proline transport system ATP-binding protein